MITLYELHWSHYCEKIRMALDYMGLEWQAVSIDAFKKTELKQYPLPAHLPNYIVPAILDDRTGAFVMDSTPILRYLAATYPDAPKLFPGDAANQACIDAALLEYDTLLGLPARRLGYTQVILECPDALADLFLAHYYDGLFSKPLLRTLAGHFLGVMLCKRFDFHRSESLHLYEALEQYLLGLAARLKEHAPVVGEHFSIADIALAAQLRPISIVPFFAEHPGLQGLFAFHRQVIAKWSREETLLYQDAVFKARQNRLPMRRRLKSGQAALPFQVAGGLSANDQQSVWTKGMWLMPLHYLMGLRSGKVRQLEASAWVR